MKLAAGYAALFAVCGAAGVAAFLVFDALAERLTKRGRR